MPALFLFLLFLIGLVSTVRGYLHVYPPIDENDTRKPLYFALLQSFGGVYNGSGSVAGLQVALDRINSDPTLLPGYSLHYTLTDSQVKYEHFLFIYTICKACSGVIANYKLRVQETTMIFIINCKVCSKLKTLQP